MPLDQEVAPINSQLMDTLVEASKLDWIQTTDLSYTKVLFTGSESGTWAVLYRWLKGYQARPHKHLSSSHTFVLSGKLKVRDAIINTGDYVYEPNGMLHEVTEALEDTDYIFICNGPIIYFDDDGIAGYKGWEEVQRLREAN